VTVPESPHTGANDGGVVFVFVSCFAHSFSMCIFSFCKITQIPSIRVCVSNASYVAHIDRLYRASRKAKKYGHRSSIAWVIRETVKWASCLRNVQLLGKSGMTRSLRVLTLFSNLWVISDGLNVIFLDMCMRMVTFHVQNCDIGRSHFLGFSNLQFSFIQKLAFSHISSISTHIELQ